jgi:hypothetical protein
MHLASTLLAGETILLVYHGQSLQSNQVPQADVVESIEMSQGKLAAFVRYLRSCPIVDRKWQNRSLNKMVVYRTK